MYDEVPMKLGKIRQAKGLIDLLEYGMALMGLYPEPLAFSLRGYDFISSRSFDVVHDNQSLGFGLLAMQQLGGTVVATIHHPIHLDRAFAHKMASSPWERAGISRWYWFLWMQGLVARRLPRIISVSRKSAQDVVRFFKVPPSRLRVIYNGVDGETFQAVPGVERCPYRIILVNSADMPIKGLPYFYKALQIVASRRPVEVVVVGERRPSHVAYLSRYHLDGQVRFLGRLTTKELVREYSAAALAVTPSLYEGFGLPVVEAMACGLPVVAFAAGALPEVLGEDGEAGRLVPCYDQEALAVAMLELLENPAKRACMGARGRERALRLFSWQRAAEETVRVYEEALAAR